MYSISEAKEAVKDGIRGYLLKDSNGKYVMNEVNRLPFYLLGSPGIGKSQIASQTADELGIGFVSFSITHHSRNTVLGLPVIKESEGYKYTEYTMSEIIARVMEKYDRGEREGILLLDEFNCMTDTLIPVMLAFLQNKNIGAHSLPEGWVVVLCGNPVKYNKSARMLDLTVMDRVRKIEVGFSADDFIEYAETHGFCQIIVDYLKLNKNRAYICEHGKEDDLVTARGWENLSVAIDVYEKTGGRVDEAMIGQFIKSGRTAREFARYYELVKSRDLTSEDMAKILGGIDIDGYCSRMEEMSVDMRFDVVDNLMKTIKERAGEKGVRQAVISDYINNVLGLLIKLGDKPAVEKAFSYINSDRKMMMILTKYKSEMFLKVCGSVYYGEEPGTAEEAGDAV
ncbi:MAG: AAA family ATPase [Lachnospiraceae bacterium]|nr:AAA family ATPase [Lachnospiraceae bacterium]